MNATLAKLLVRVIPGSCPFARDIKLFGKVVSVPPLCKLNPFYGQLMKLRFKALIRLEDS
ncbi:MAG TPA: hypothetical protein DCE56_02405 [Cyanobacteria bacterium UBA8553]|nr:hypothetical protein [Cyanobacteria bacterium UBA8553]HAJ63932.1 hypothetical protein [Cyanobacteria bacterium UBA8543]